MTAIQIRKTAHWKTRSVFHHQAIAAGAHPFSLENGRNRRQVRYYLETPDSLHLFAVTRPRLIA